MRDLPPLSSLRSFEAAARLGSVTRAAVELGRTHGAVSKQIRLLQDRLGAPLFDKAGTGLVLNVHGRALYQATAASLDDLAIAWARVAASARAPALHVACSATFAMRWLVPNLAGFARDHPQVRVRLSMTSAREIRLEGADLVLAWDWTAFPAEERARAVRVAEVAFGPVVSPDYPLTRTDLGLSAPCRIAHDFTTRAWDLWQSKTGLRLDARSEISFPHTHLCIEAAASGLGVALVERRLAAEELSRGRLIDPVGFAPFEQGLAAIPAAGPISPQARAFLDWLAEAMAQPSPAV